MPPSKFVRLQWWPPVPLALLAYMLVRCVVGGPTLFRIAGVMILGAWAALAIYDRRSGGRLLRWMYPDHPDDLVN